jgi:hypothetical protein
MKCCEYNQYSIKCILEWSPLKYFNLIRALTALSFEITITTGSALESCSQHFIFFVTYEWPHKLECLSRQLI